MSKIKIQGNASGTGVLTVTAPNTSTDRTITLPDATATLATTTGGVAQLDHSGTKKLEATSTGATLTGDLAINDAHPEITLTDSDDTSYSVAYHSAGAFLIDVDKGQDVANSYFRLSIDDTPRLRVTADGLLFNSDTAAANALDDYEEGTWTPHVYVDSSHSGIVYAGNQGTYTKISNTVSCHAAIQLSNKGSSSGNVTIRNFPYAIEDWSSYTSTDGGSVTIGYVAGTSGLSDLKLAGNQANYIQGFVRTNSTGDVTGTFTNSHITNGFSLRISFHYQTA